MFRVCRWSMGHRVYVWSVYMQLFTVKDGPSSG